MKQIMAATSNMLARIRELEVTANNLSNSNTPGYKRDLYFANVIADVQQDMENRGLFEGSVRLTERNVVDMSQGTLHKTDNSLDTAINGDGFFVVADQDGNEYYTRNGNFQIDNEGFLITNYGYRVQGEGGEIYLPNGSIRISPEGNITSDDDLIDQLRIVMPEDPQEMAKMGNSRYQFNPVEPEERGEVIQGFLEQSNVSPIESMIKLVALQRDFDSNQKMVQSFDEINKRSANDIGRI